MNYRTKSIKISDSNHIALPGRRIRAQRFWLSSPKEVSETVRNYMCEMSAPFEQWSQGIYSNYDQSRIDPMHSIAR